MTKPQEKHDNQAVNPSDLRASKLRKKEALLEAGLQAYPHVFDRQDLAADVQAKYADLPDGTDTEDLVTVAGRIHAMRNNGMFIDLRDSSGKIQIFCHKDRSPSEELEKLAFFDIGDVVGVTGKVRRTPRGELSIAATELTMLTKSVLPLPEKYHGLSDVESRYRQRYLDLIMNEDSRETLRMRSKIVSTIRRTMEDMGAIEVETPNLHPIMGGASAKPFTTHHNALDTEFFLRVAPELYLKRLIVGGLADDVFEIGRCFRNEGISVKHNPEFTSIEGYHAYKDYNDMMDIVEKIVEACVKAVHGTTKVTFGGQEIDFAGPWPRKSMCELVLEHAGVDMMAIESDEEARAAAKAAGVHVDETAKWGHVVEALFEEKAEGTLIQPTHVTDFPIEISPLAKTHRDHPRLVERFESFVNGWELANAFTELNDPAVQRERFMDQVAAAEAGDEEVQMLDEDFIAALEYGLPPTGGWGLGIDRLCMLLTDSPNIRDVILFPTLKPVKVGGKKAAPLPVEPVKVSCSVADVDENARRFVVVVNGKEETGRVMNALGHTMAGLVGHVAKDQDFVFLDYVDKDGGVHPGISHYPVIVLKAKNSNQIKKIRAEAMVRGMPFSDFVDTMTIGGSQEQLDATAECPDEELSYLGVCLFGETETLKEFTGKLSLYK